MPIQATVILDSGCFLPGDDNSPSTEIGYFQSSRSSQDIRVIADGEEKIFTELKNLGKNCLIEIRHVKADGTIYDKGAKASTTFHDELLHLKHLYGEDIPVDPKKFDCILRFDSGYFCGALVKPRNFKLHRQQAAGNFTHSPEDAPKSAGKPIAHNVHVHFKLKKSEAIELVRDGKVVWSSTTSGAKDRLEIEVIADNTTADKFYRQALKDKRDNYWSKNLHVIPQHASWVVRSERSERAISVHATQAEAIEAAREIAQHRGSEIIIHRADGRIRERKSYRTNPRLPKLPREVLFPRVPTVTDKEIIKKAIKEVINESPVSSERESRT